MSNMFSIFINQMEKNMEGSITTEILKFCLRVFFNRMLRRIFFNRMLRKIISTKIKFIFNPKLIACYVKPCICDLITIEIATNQFFLFCHTCYASHRFPVTATVYIAELQSSKELEEVNYWPEAHNRCTIVRYVKATHVQRHEIVNIQRWKT